jgi:hypothetical protein
MCYRVQQRHFLRQKISARRLENAVRTLRWSIYLSSPETGRRITSLRCSNEQVHPLSLSIKMIRKTRNERRDQPFPSLVLALPLPLIKSHIRRVLSFPTLSATLPLGCTATELTRPLCPCNDRNTAQSRARKRQSVPSSDAESRCERDGNDKCVIDPVRDYRYGIFNK